MRAHSKCVALRTSLLCLNPPFSHHSVCLCTQSWPTLCNPMGCSLLGSSARGIFQARILEWVAISSSRESSQPRDGTTVSYMPCLGGWILLPLRHLGISFHYSRPLFTGHPSFISLHLLSFMYQGYLLYNHLSHWLMKKSRRRIHSSSLTVVLILCELAEGY